MRRKSSSKEQKKLKVKKKGSATSKDVAPKIDTFSQAALQYIHEQLQLRWLYCTPTSRILSWQIRREVLLPRTELQCEEKSEVKRASCCLSSWDRFLGSPPPKEVMSTLFEALFEGVEKGFAKELGDLEEELSGCSSCCCSQSKGITDAFATCHRGILWEVEPRINEGGDPGSESAL
ncbi:hypothetical protein HHK36_025853 [Tetracentron sinense]|uniref:Uncharacterized protein n=1 Tax=Tetracentron sinense TaxID=13715 RepID=A0A834YLZ8_TETSI|nr:hypothetical protein HHK36_025853 [Tetracentron sinense]